jgi:hypothetical protein
MVPLIDALVTKHFVVVPGSGHPDAVSTSFGKVTDSSGNVLAGGQSFTKSTPPQQVPIRVPNQEVLTALIKLAGGANFGFDAPAWKAWYHAQARRIGAVETRRDNP